MSENAKLGCLSSDWDLVITQQLGGASSVAPQILLGRSMRAPILVCFLIRIFGENRIWGPRSRACRIRKVSSCTSVHLAVASNLDKISAHSLPSVVPGKKGKKRQFLYRDWLVCLFTTSFLCMSQLQPRR